MQRLVRSDIAMTGEISLRGRILRVGGIKEKVLAAVRTGLKEVVLPDQNRSDWLELPEGVRQKIKATFVGKISDLLPNVFKNR
jgi:ATP-dependent Lon protease